jgi:hypothetical protein
MNQKKRKKTEGAAYNGICRSIHFPLDEVSSAQGKAARAPKLEHGEIVWRRNGARLAWMELLLVRADPI